MIATGDDAMMKKLKAYKETLKQKIVKANEDLSKVAYQFKTN
jgi:5-(carboxyamino)imidazole ribonucleotide mutase